VVRAEAASVILYGWLGRVRRDHLPVPPQVQAAGGVKAKDDEPEPHLILLR
jgi:hypothetical protein